LRFIHNCGITGIQWMVCWWVLVHCGWNRADCILQGQREPIGNIWEQVENFLKAIHPHNTIGGRRHWELEEHHEEPIGNIWEQVENF